ncbi:MAG TPA: response regulator transcription factor [Candidatus Aquabacterium excrementipullorum]|nr:response regulator transcription factor [Candidatus Aquabacterium excrementipullorum]
MYTLLFVDDHPLYREGVRRALSDAMPGLRILLADRNASAQTVLAAEPEIDLCLSDFQLPDGDGLALLGQVARQHPTVARGLLCGAPDAAMARQAQMLGCVACLSKDRDIASLGDALRTLFEGGSVYDVAPAPALGTTSLSDKRKEILRLAAKGLSNKEISGLLGISERTVKDHWSYIFEQMGVSNRTEAVSQALRERLL